MRQVPLRYFFYILLLPALLFPKPRFSDTQLKAMTPRYFARNHSAPELLGVAIYKSNKGRVFQVDIAVDRNRANNDLGFAYTALTTMGQYAKKPFQQFIVVMHYDQRERPPRVAVGEAKCSLDCFIRKKVSYEYWWENCIYFQEM